MMELSSAGDLVKGLLTFQDTYTDNILFARGLMLERNNAKLSWYQIPPVEAQQRRSICSPGMGSKGRRRCDIRFCVALRLMGLPRVRARTGIETLSRSSSALL